MYNQTNHVGCHRAMCGAGFMTPPHDLSCRKSQVELNAILSTGQKGLEVKRRSKTVHALLFYFVVVADKESLFNF